MHLRRPSGEVDGVAARPIQRVEAGVDDVPRHHGVGAIGTRIHVTVAARHVAELAEVHLEDLERVRAKPAVTVQFQRVLEVGFRPVAVRDRNPGQGVELGVGRHEGEPAGGHGLRSLRTGFGAAQLFGEGGENVFDASGIHDYMPALRVCSSIWMPWTSEAPPRIAVATCTASVICSRSAPVSSDSVV